MAKLKKNQPILLEFLRARLVEDEAAAPTAPDPARALRAVEAKRALIEAYEQKDADDMDGDDFHDGLLVGGGAAYMHALELTANEYADHPDWHAHLSLTYKPARSRRKM